MSNLIYSSVISTPEALGAATRIKADMHSATVHDLSNVVHICDESKILHVAAGILRRQISDITISDDEYLAPEEVSISNSGAKLHSFFLILRCVCKQKQIDFFPFGDCITDVLVLCVFYLPEMQHTEELWVCMVTVSGGRDGRRYIPVHDLCSSLSNITCQNLPSLHALTGCDTTSAFFQNWEKYVYKFLKTSPEELSDLVSLTNADLESTINTARHALSLLCDSKGKFKPCHPNLNMLLVKLATSKDVLLSRIPPSEPYFKQHVLRSSLQATV